MGLPRPRTFPVSSSVTHFRVPRQEREPQRLTRSVSEGVKGRTIPPTLKSMKWGAAIEDSQSSPHSPASKEWHSPSLLFQKR